MIATKDNKFKLWLEACLEFDNFSKRYVKMMSETPTHCVEKFIDYEETNEQCNIDGKVTYSEVIIYDEDGCEPELMLVTQNGDIRYRLRLIDIELGDMEARITPPNPNGLDFDGVAVLETIKLSTNQRIISEVIAMRTREEYKLVFRELVGANNNYKQRNIQTKTLTDEQVCALLGKVDTKRL